MNSSGPSNISSAEFSEHLFNDLTEGLHSLLFKPVSGLAANDELIASAFSSFISKAEHGDSFTVGDIIFGAETIIKGGEPFPADGYTVWCIDKLGKGKYSKKLLKLSVGGVYALLNLRNGFNLDMDAIGGSLPAGEIKRFALIPLRKGEKLAAKAAMEGVNMVDCGTVLAANGVIFSRGREVMGSFDRSILFPKETVTLELDSSMRAEYMQGYNAVCTYAACRSVTENVIIRFALGGGLQKVCARALGYFAALMFLKCLPVNIVFTSEENCDVAVPRPSAEDGDYLYLLRVRDGESGLPDRIHLGQLCYYLSEMKKRGIIKDVLPIKKNVDATIERLCGETLEYVPLADIPEKCGGVIVSVRRGDSVNGIKLGYFRNIS